MEDQALYLEYVKLMHRVLALLAKLVFPLVDVSQTLRIA